MLTKRILALKVKDGLHINVQEAEREMKVNMQRMQVNPSSIDQQVDDIIAAEASDTNQAASATGDLLDIGDGVKPKNVLEEVKELSELLGTSSSHGASASTGSKKFQSSHPEDFSPD